MKDRILLLLVAGGFFLLTVETRYIHAAHFDLDKFSIIPPIAGAVGFLMCLVALIRSTRPYVGTLMFLFSLIGPLGFYVHSQANAGKNPNWIQSNLHADRMEANRAAGAFVNDAPPSLAPLSFGGFYLIGGVICVFGDKKRKPSA